MGPGIDGGGLAGRLAADLSALDAELAEIDLLISQATGEAERHEQKRAGASERLAAAQSGGESPTALVEQATALVGLTRRAVVMEAQVDVLSGKRKILGRYRDALTAYVDALASNGGLDAGSSGGRGAGVGPEGAAPGRAGPASGVVLAAQEDLRREIARAMHDGPAQSLTNIVLQAQIVERLVDRDPTAARAEVRQLVDMVQRTLDATKSFIFEVRPMVLDDLGLVPTLRGAARDRGRRSGIGIAFDSFGPDRRLPTDLESGLFRLLDDALAAYLVLRPGQVTLRLDWAANLEARITAAPAGAVPERGEPEDATGAAAEETPVPAAPARKGRSAESAEAATDLPPALAQMIAQRRDDELAARARARRGRDIVLPAAAWEGLRTRAESLGLRAELLDGGSTVQITVELPAAAVALPA